MHFLPEDPIKQLISIILFVVISFAVSYWFYRSCCKNNIEEEEIYEYGFAWDESRSELIKVRRPKPYYNPQLAAPSIQEGWNRNQNESQGS